MDVEAIINYLTLEELKVSKKDCNSRIKYAFIQAKKKFKKLSEEEKKKLIDIIENGGSVGT